MLTSSKTGSIDASPLRPLVKRKLFLEVSAQLKQNAAVLLVKIGKTSRPALRRQTPALIDRLALYGNTDTRKSDGRSKGWRRWRDPVGKSRENGKGHGL